MTFDLQRIREGRSTEGIRRVLTPEGVEVEFALADRGQRLIAVLVDLSVQVFASLAVFVLILIIWGVLFGTGLNGTEFFTVALGIVSFFFQFFYFLTMEVFWQGKTLGKHLMGLRVIGANGHPLSLSGLVARNFMRQVELFLPLIAGAGLVGPTSTLSSLVSLAWAFGLSAYIFFDADRRRLGDLLGGTIVVKQAAPVLLPDIAAGQQETRARFRFTTDQLETYGRFELQVLEGVLREDHRPDQEEIFARIVARICLKIGNQSEVAPEFHRDFLNDFYAAQRQHLEREALYGKRKDSKADSNGGP
jgi:uncharacterized RDD family membrane protein YckC